MTGWLFAAGAIVVLGAWMKWAVLPCVIAYQLGRAVERIRLAVVTRPPGRDWLLIGAVVSAVLLAIVTVVAVAGIIP